jgi:hypothetical protein
MGGGHLPKYLGSPISGGTAANQDACFDESDSLLPGQVGQRACRRGPPVMTVLRRAHRAAGAVV